MGLALLMGALSAKRENVIDRLRTTPATVVLTNGAKADPTALKMERVWRGAGCVSSAVVSPHARDHPPFFCSTPIWVISK
jgi:hypothetical protein